MPDVRETDTLIVGAGVTGLAVAALLGRQADYLVLEREAEPGGYCRTVERDGFVWDYSGHFFHFRNPRIEAWLRARMAGEEVRTIQRRAFVQVADRRVDFPIQRNLHQLPQGDFLRCLHDLYFAQKEVRTDEANANLQEHLLSRYGQALCELFLLPYNEKLYATSLQKLDPGAMGRFFPHVTFDEVMRHLVNPEGAGYNQSFTYPRRGAASYIRALSSEVDPSRVRLEEKVERIDLDGRIVATSRGSYRFRRLVSSMPLPSLLRAMGREVPSSLTANQVLVFNLGFDRKGDPAPHWVYFPQRELPFYRVGYYDNIFESDRMSLYVELGFPGDARPDSAALLPKVLEGLRAAGIVTDQRLVASHSVVMNPAYVHLSRESLKVQRALDEELRGRDVFSMGRYGRWTYCSIEDNLLEAEEWTQRRFE